MRQAGRPARDDRSAETDRREKRRRSVILTATLRTDNGDRPCRVDNLSAGGVRIKVETPPSPGTPVHLEHDRFGTFPAVVAWAGPDWAGLVFPEGPAATLARFGAAAARLGLIDPAE